MDQDTKDRSAPLPDRAEQAEGDGIEELANESLKSIGRRRAYPGARRGFGGGRYSSPYSGSYGGEFRTDYRGTRSR